jgi:hypothetical protein
VWEHPRPSRPTAASNKPDGEAPTQARNHHAATMAGASGRRPGRCRPGQHLHLTTPRPRERSPLSRGHSQGHAVLESPAPRVDGQPLGAVRARSRPVVDQEHLTIDGQRNASHAAVVTSAAAPLRTASPDGFVWPPGRVRKRGVPGAAELIAHAAPSGDQAPPSRWPRVRIPYPGPKDGNRIGRRKFRNRNEHQPRRGSTASWLPTAQV